MNMYQRNSLNKAIEERTKEVLDAFARSPTAFSTTVQTVVLRHILLKTEGKVLAEGCFWNIKTKSLGAGVYRIYLEKEE